MFPTLKRPGTSGFTPHPKERHETAEASAKTPCSPPQPSRGNQKSPPPSFAKLIANLPESHDEYKQRLALAAWRSIPSIQPDAPDSSARQSSLQSPVASTLQGAHVGQQPLLPSFADFTANMPEPYDDHMQSVSVLPADRLTQAPTPPAPKPTISTSGKFRRVRQRVNPDTGKPVLEGTRGAIAPSTFHSRRLVNPKTGEPATKDTKDPISAQKFRQNKLVDPETGMPASKDTKSPITTKKFCNRKLVDPRTGEPASKDTESPITAAVFYNNRLVDPGTGEPIRPGATNGIPYQRYIKSRPVHPISGESVKPGTEGAITIGAFQARQRRKSKSN
jgi:hypothetical protein